jgi:hypothetical protein
MTTPRSAFAAVGQHERRAERAGRLPDFLIVGAMRCRPRLRRTAKRLPPDLGTRRGDPEHSQGRYEPMSPDVRSAVADTFREDVRSLSPWLGRDISDWTH